jgi:AraC-like DNA-binding protein
MTLHSPAAINASFPRLKSHDDNDGSAISLSVKSSTSSYMSQVFRKDHDVTPLISHRQGGRYYGAISKNTKIKTLHVAQT